MGRYNIYTNNGLNKACSNLLRTGGFHQWGYPQSSSISNDGIFPELNHPASLGNPHDEMEIPIDISKNHSY